MTRLACFLVSLFFATGTYAQLNVSRYAEDDIFTIKPVVTPESLKEKSQESWTEKVMNEALGHIENQRYDQAIERLDAVIKDTPAYPVPYYFKGMIYLEQHALEKARKMFTEALRAEPLYLEAKYMLGVVAIEAGEYDEGMAHFDDLTNVKAYEALGYYGKGITRIREGNAYSATFFLKRAVAKDPNMLEAYETLVEMNLARSNPTAALYWLNRGIRDNPDWEEGIFFHGLVNLMFYGRTAVFEEDVNKLIAKDPDNPRYLFVKGYYLVIVKRDQEALKLFEQSAEQEETAIKYSPGEGIEDSWMEHALYCYFTYDKGDKDSEDLIWKALCRMIRREGDSAIETLTGAASLKESATASFLLAIAYEMKELREEALELYDLTLTLEEKMPLALAYRGNLLMKMEEFEKAGADFNQLTKLLPQESIPYLQRGEANEQLEKFREAREDFTLAIEFDSANYEAFARRASVYLELEDSVRAKEDAMHVITRFPQHGPMYYVMYKIRILKKDTLMAVAMLDSASNFLLQDTAKHLELADLAEKCRQPEVAVKAYKRLLISTGKSKYMLDQGRVLLENEKYEDAIEVLLGYLTIHRKSREACYHLAEAYDAMGDERKSSKYMKKAKKYPPSEEL